MKLKCVILVLLLISQEVVLTKTAVRNRRMLPEVLIQPHVEVEAKDEVKGPAFLNDNIDSFQELVTDKQSNLKDRVSDEWGPLPEEMPTVPEELPDRLFEFSPTYQLNEGDFDLTFTRDHGQSVTSYEWTVQDIFETPKRVPDPHIFTVFDWSMDYIQHHEEYCAAGNKNFFDASLMEQVNYLYGNSNVGFWDTFDPVNAQNLDQQYMFENAALTAEEMIDTHYKVQVEIRTQFQPNSDLEKMLHEENNDIHDALAKHFADEESFDAFVENIIDAAEELIQAFEELSDMQQEETLGDWLKSNFRGEEGDMFWEDMGLGEMSMEDMRMGEMGEMGEMMNMEEISDMLMAFFEDYADDYDSLTVVDIKEKLKNKEMWDEKQDMLFEELLALKNGGFEEWLQDLEADNEEVGNAKDQYKMLNDRSEEGLDGLLPNDVQFEEWSDDFNKATAEFGKNNSPIARAAAGFKIDRRGRQDFKKSLMDAEDYLMDMEMEDMSEDKKMFEETQDKLMQMQEEAQDMYDDLNSKSDAELKTMFDDANEELMQLFEELNGCWEEMQDMFNDQSDEEMMEWIEKRFGSVGHKKIMDARQNLMDMVHDAEGEEISQDAFNHLAEEFFLNMEDMMMSNEETMQMISGGIGQLEEELADLNYEEIYDSIRDCQEEINDDIKEYFAEAGPDAENYNDAVSFDEQLWGGGRTMFYNVLRDIYHQHDNMDVVEELTQTLEGQLKGENKKVVTINSEVLKSGFTYMVKAFAYNKNRVPIAVQFFQFTIVDEVPVSTTVSGDTGSVITLDDQCIKQCEEITATWPNDTAVKYNLSGYAIEFGPLFTLESDNECHKKSVGYTSKREVLGVDKSSYKFKIDDANIVGTRFYYVRLSGISNSNQVNHEWVTYKIIPVSQDSESIKSCTQKNPVPLIGAKHQAITFKAIPSDMPVDAETDGPTPPPNDKNEMPFRDYEDFMRQVQGQTLLEYTKHDPYVQIALSSCLGNPATSPFLMYDQYTKNFKFGVNVKDQVKEQTGYEVPKVDKRRDDQCNDKSGVECSGHGTCDQIADGDIVNYSCTCDNDYVNTKCDKTKTEQQGLDAAKTKVLNDKMKDLGVTVTPANQKLPDKVNKLSDSDKEAAIAATLAITASGTLTKEQIGQSVGILNTIAAPENIKTAAEAASAQAAVSSVITSTLSDPKMSKEEKRKLMEDSHLNEISEKIVTSQSLLLLSNADKKAGDTADISIGKQVGTLTVLGTGNSQIRCDAKIVDSKGKSFAPPTATIGAIPGAQLASIKASTCEDALVNCQPGTVVVDLTVLDENGKPMVLPEGTTIDYEIPVGDTDVTKLECQYWDVQQDRLSRKGVTTVDRLPGVLKCKSTHTTSFTAGNEDDIPKEETPVKPPAGSSNPSNPNFGSFQIISILSVVIALII